ncbi:MAG: hypothetical protein ABUS57_19365 [Pseudomonadota bacterium]
MKARLFPLIGAIAASLALASCGVRTGLEQPAPMWGKARRDYYAEQERAKAEAAAHPPSTAPEIPPLGPPNIPLGHTPISPMSMPNQQPPGG